MRSRRTSAQHQEAVSRRLADLSAELAAGRARADEGNAVAPAAGGEWWSEHTRVAERPPLAVVTEDVRRPSGHPAWRPDPDPPPVPEVPELPVPGRHAARRAVPGRPLLPDTLRGRWLLGPSQLAVVAVLVAAGLAVTAWLVIRSDPGEPVPALPPAPASEPPAALVPDAGAAAGGGAPGAGAAGGEVTVDVAGKVRRPGIVVLDAGSRVVDALEAAGGARPKVDTTGLNLARVLVDGEQILVGAPAAPGGAAPPVGARPPAGSPGTGSLVNINLATQTELEELPEIGPVTAQAIIAWREEHGGFSRVEELLEVDGIGDATLEQVAPHVTV